MTPPTALDMDVAQADYDALADLFLADAYPALDQPSSHAAVPETPRPAQQNGRAVPRPDAPDIHAVIAGHLPVLASAWVTQYARHQADAHREPVVLLRLAGGQALIDLVLPSGHKLPADAAPAPGAALEQVLSSIAGRFPRWILRVDEAAETDLFRQPLASVALLTGADDPAVVASFQTIKGLSMALPQSPPPVELVIMGAPADRADAAEMKLRRAFSTFFGEAPPTATRIPRIHSSVTLQLYRAPTTAPLDDIIAAIRTPTLRPQVSPPAPEPRPEPKAPAAPEPVVQAPPFAAQSLPATLPASLSALPFTCPYAPGITFATDAAGGLHLVASTTISPELGAQRLLTAAAWAHDHASLLSAASPGLRQASDPTLHVLLADARQGRPLLDTGLKVHLVTRVEVQGHTAHAVSPLN